MLSHLRPYLPTTGSLAAATWIIAALTVACAIGLLIDTRLVLGVNPWLKPLRFCVSLIIYLVTMHAVFRLVPVRGASFYAAIFSAAALIEVLLISMQSLRGVASHHNVSTPFDSAVYSTMGVVIAINTLAVAALLVQTALENFSVPPLLLRAIQFGLVFFLVGSAIGIVMSFRGAHAVGAPDAGPGLPVAGWSTQGGDLRAAHFLGLHGLQLMLLAGILLAAWVKEPRRENAAFITLYALLCLWATLTAAAYFHAMSGRPIIDLSPGNVVRAPAKDTP